jgi:UDP-N-acetylmuramyl pentapeptide phosphotransferase/UDP-N-acetylglucosamine-1-phosphate transferase
MKVAVKKNIMDIPNIRSSHTQPTPRGGGLAIVLSWYIGLIAFKLLGMIELNLFLALFSGSILAIISFLDDLYDIKPLYRIFFQFVTVLLGIYFIGGFKIIYINGSTLRFPTLYSCIAVIGVIWFINLFNFLDGIDGYASTETITVLFGMFLLVHNPIFLLLIFAVLGFLIWNWPKAKIFLGDIGSTQLGYILIMLGIYFNNGQKINFITWLMLTSLFWFDATLTLFRRYKNKEKLSVAHKKHAYQRIVQSGFSHLKTIWYSIVINIIILSLVYISTYSQALLIPVFILNMLLLYGITLLVDKRLPFR